MRALAQALLVGAATVGAAVGGLYLLSRTGRHRIRENRQALFNEHLAKVENESINAIAFQDFLSEHKGGLGSSLSNGQLRTALIEIPKLDGKSEYLHTVLLGDSIYAHNDPKTGRRSIFTLQQNKEGNIVLEKKPLKNDLPVLRVHSHPMKVNKSGELSFSSPLHSMFEGITGTFIQYLGGDFAPSKSPVNQTHFSDRVPLHTNYGGYYGFGDGMWTALAFSELLRIAVDR
jgi:hypothetical protein